MTTRRFEGLETQAPGWDGDLQDLARETQALLSSIRADTTGGGTRRGNGRKSTAGKTAGTRRRRKEAAGVTSTTLDLAQSPIKPRLKLGRETVEVLDTASNPASVRQEEEESTDISAPQSARRPTAETSARDLNFEAEEERLREVGATKNKTCTTVGKAQVFSHSGRFPNVINEYCLAYFGCRTWTRSFLDQAAACANSMRSADGLSAFTR